MVILWPTHDHTPRPGIDDSTNSIHQELCRDAREPLVVLPNPSMGGITKTVPCQAFPGGNFDPKQDADDFRMTALRETFEETGILLVEQTTAQNAALPEPEQLAAERLAIHSRTDPRTFPDFLSDHRLRPPVDSLVPFSQWVTPETAAVRFHTRFFVLFVEDLELGLGSGSGSGLEAEAEVAGGVVKQSRRPPPNDNADSDANAGGQLPLLPTPKDERTNTNIDVLVQNPTADGGVEVISASWIHPRELFAAFRRGELALFPPQFYLLTTLLGLLDSMHQGGGHQGGGSNRTTVLRSRIGGGGGGFGSRLFNPQPTGFTDEGGKGQRTIMTYEGDELRGGKAGDRHRCLVLYQGRVSLARLPVSSSLLLTLPKRITDIELQRNIDVLTPPRSDSKTKL